MRNITALAMTEAIHEAKNETNLNDRMRVAMNAVKNHWLVIDKNEQFQAAVAAIYSLSNDDEKERIKAEVDLIKITNATISGIPVSFDAVKKHKKPVGLIKVWDEINKQPARMNILSKELLSR